MTSTSTSWGVHACTYRARRHLELYIYIHGLNSHTLRNEVTKLFTLSVGPWWVHNNACLKIHHQFASLWMSSSSSAASRTTLHPEHPSCVECMCLKMARKSCNELTCGLDSLSWKPALSLLARRLGIFRYTCGLNCVPSTDLHSLSGVPTLNTNSFPAYVRCWPDNISYKWRTYRTNVIGTGNTQVIWIVYTMVQLELPAAPLGPSSVPLNCIGKRTRRGHLKDHLPSAQLDPLYPSLHSLQNKSKNLHKKWALLSTLFKLAVT